MNEANGSTPSARLRPGRLRAWIWIVPVMAALLVMALGARALVERGPLITISFNDAEGLQAGTTPVRHKDVDLGMVESIYLSRDMSRVLVRVRMHRSVSSHLTAGTRFWIVRPRVGLGGVSGLSTLVSGSYIEMYPGPGPGIPQRQFVGLAEPPMLTPETPGSSYTLHTTNLGSLVAGSPISYRGIAVGQVQGFALDQLGTQISIFTFIRAPYDKLVNAQSRFWNSGGIDVSVGTAGVRFRAASWQELISGGISFDTPDNAKAEAASAAGTQFHLYDNQNEAQRDPRGSALRYLVDFVDTAGDVAPGSPVQLLGSEVGQITESRLQYDDARQSLLRRVTLEIDPSRIQITHSKTNAATDSAEALNSRLAKLVARGLRARLISANLITGAKVVSLDIVHDAPAARIDQVDGYARLPSAYSTDISDILASAQATLHHLETATAGPELADAIKELDRTLTTLDRTTAAIEPEIKPLLMNLRQASEAAQRAMQAAEGVLGNEASSSTDLPRLIRELTEAARSTRELTSYLERHPEALLRGRAADRP
jgi:paraquat-inducible protein B